MSPVKVYLDYFSEELYNIKVIIVGSGNEAVSLSSLRCQGGDDDDDDDDNDGGDTNG